MNCNIAVIKGDGIGPEIVEEAMKVLDVVGKKYGHQFCYSQILLGGASIDAYGVPLSDEALQIAKESDAVLMGSIGGNTTTSPWYQLPPALRPEAGLLKIRKELGLFANIRPAYLYKELANIYSPLIFWQFIIQPLILFVFIHFSIESAHYIASIKISNKLKHVLSIISNLTLDIYVIQITIINLIEQINIKWPYKIGISIILILIGAYWCNKISNLAGNIIKKN